MHHIGLSTHSIGKEQNVTREAMIARSSEMCYSFRRLYPGYDGSCVRLRRISDNAEMDFGFLNNYVDTAAITTWVGGSSATMVTWYDQSPNGRDATNSTASTQPSLDITSGIASWDGTSGVSGDFLDPSTDINEFLTGSSYYVNVVLVAYTNAEAYYLGVFRNGVSSGDRNNTVLHIGIQDASNYTLSHFGDDGVYSAAVSSGSPEIHQAQYIAAGSSRYCINGACATDTTPAADLDQSAALLIGYGDLRAWNGRLYELIVNGGDGTVTADQITQVMNEYYNIF